MLRRVYLQYAHRKCVQHWCNEKGDTTCEICHQVCDFILPLHKKLTNSVFLLILALSRTALVFPTVIVYIYGNGSNLGVFLL